LLEAKDGIESKLSAAQKSVFRTAFNSGKISIMSSSAAESLGLRAGAALVLI
jgi:hypothetical protein